MCACARTHTRVLSRIVSVLCQSIVKGRGWNENKADILSSSFQSGSMADFTTIVVDHYCSVFKKRLSGNIFENLAFKDISWLRLLSAEFNNYLWWKRCTTCSVVLQHWKFFLQFVFQYLSKVNWFLANISLVVDLSTARLCFFPFVTPSPHTY